MSEHTVTRREFVKASAVVAAAASAPAVARMAHGAGSDRLRVGLVGCGGRGTGAAVNCLQASEQAEIVALADLFDDRLTGALGHLQGDGNLSPRVNVPASSRYLGFDAYKQLMASDIDSVILATPPHFRPMMLEHAINSGKHVFMEKPVAVDPFGIRQIMAAGEQADKKGLNIVAGTQRRHERKYQETMKRVHDGAIGRIVSARAFWNMGELWSKKRLPSYTDIEWQIRNWLYFTWLSGDHITEQHVHNLDVINWAMGTHPIKAMGMGGRQVRTDPQFGNIFDHHAIEFEYPGGVFMTSMCRQTNGCANRVNEYLAGAEGSVDFGRGIITGANKWKFAGDNPNPYVVEHADLIAAINGGPRFNEARNVAESTLTAIMGRMSTYTGKAVTWEQAINSTLHLGPTEYDWNMDLPVAPVAVPGKTPLV